MDRLVVTWEPQQSEDGWCNQKSVQRVSDTVHETLEHTLNELVAAGMGYSTKIPHLATVDATKIRQISC